MVDGDRRDFSTVELTRLGQRVLALVAGPTKSTVALLPDWICRLLKRRWRIEAVIGPLKRDLGLEFLSNCWCIDFLKTTVFSA